MNANSDNRLDLVFPLPVALGPIIVFASTCVTCCVFALTLYLTSLISLNTPIGTTPKLCIKIRIQQAELENFIQSSID